MKYLFSVLLSATWLVIVPSQLQADVTAAHQNESAAAFQALDGRAKETRAQGDLPRWADPGDAKVLVRLWNVPSTLGGPPYRSADIPALLDLADRAGTVYKAYLLFAPQAGAVPDTAANNLKYQDEIVRAGAYQLRVQTALLAALTDFVQELPPSELTPARKMGLAQMRLGINETITGMVLMLRSPGLRADNRAILADALAEGAEAMAMAMPPADRLAIGAQIQAVLPALSGADHEKLLAFQSAFAREDCAVLCAMVVP